MMHKHGVYLMFMKLIKKCPKNTGRPDFKNIAPPSCDRCIVYRMLGVKCNSEAIWAEYVKGKKEPVRFPY